LSEKRHSFGQKPGSLWAVDSIHLYAIKLVSGLAQILQDLCETALAIPVATVEIMHVLWAVNANTEVDMFFFQKVENGDTYTIMANLSTGIVMDVREGEMAPGNQGQSGNG
jgi:hypothetical protein